MRHMLGNLSPNYFERTKRYMMLRASRQGTDLTVSGTPPLSLPNSLGKPLKAWSVDVLPYQEGTGDPSPSNVRPIHGTNQISFVMAGKNLYNSATFQTITRHGVTCTNNGDGSFTLNGTAALDIFFDIFKPQFSPPIGGTPLPNANYRMSGCPSGGGIETYYLYITPNYHNDYGSGVSFTGQVNGGSIFVKNGFTCNNLVFRPQICLASAPNPTEFVPYLAPSQTVLTLPQTVYTGTIGSEGGESRTAKYVITADDVNYVVFENGCARVTLNRIVYDRDNTYKIGRCNKYTFRGTYASLVGNNNSIAFNASSGIQILVRDDTITTSQQFIDSVTAEPIVCEYPLATPTQFPLTAPTIPTPTGTATTWATAEDGTVDGMKVTYVGKA